MKSVSRALACTLALSLVLSGCGALPSRSTGSMQLNQFIAPVRDSLATPTKKPLVLPATVAILMVPSRNPYMLPDTTLSTAAMQLRQKLLENKKYVSAVAIVTPEDKTARMTLARLSELYGADIIITLAYEQDQRSSQSGVAALLDATLVGDFLVPGIKTTTTTFVDGKIIHAPSDAIIFRLSGSDERSVWATRYATRNSESEQQSIDSLVAATNDFGNKLNQVFVQFDKYDMSKAVPVDSVLAQGPADTPVNVASLDATPAGDANWTKVDSFKREGGALDPVELAALLGLGLIVRRRGRV